MDKYILLKLTSLSIGSFLASIGTYWTITFLPQFVTINLNQKNELLISNYASLFINSYIVGNVLATVFWPIVDKKLTKK